MKAINVSLVGVGGQGIILTANLLAETAAIAGMDVKKSEIHGMAQRGGSVISSVRFGTVVHSPIIPEGASDILWRSIAWRPCAGRTASPRTARCCSTTWISCR